MVKYLTKHGNSWALVIDKPILDLLKIDGDETPLNIETDGTALVVSPTSKARRKKFEQAKRDMFERYGDVLKKLAE